jgi:DNA-binding winged helix-turn-helix (wHTH) protein
MQLEAHVTPLPTIPGELESVPGLPSEDVPFVIAVTDDVSTRVQLVRRLPVGTVLLLAPDRASAERVLRTASEEPEPVPVSCGGLVVDLQRQRVTWYGAALRLTRLERRLLACLIEPPLRVWPYDLLYRTVWRQAWLGDTSTVHAIVKRLRRRLRDAGVTVVVESIRGVGFSLVFQPAEIASASRADLAITAGTPRQLPSSSESAMRAAATPSWKRVTTP